MMLLIPALVGANTIICRYLNAMYAKHNTQGMGTLTNYITGLAASLVALLALGEPAAFQPIGPLTFRTVFMVLGGALGHIQQDAVDRRQAHGLPCRHAGWPSPLSFFPSHSSGLPLARW